MKRSLSLLLCLAVVTMGGTNFQSITYAEGTDADTSATTWVEEVTTPVTAPAQNPSTPSPQIANGETYTVVSGDVLWRVAQKNNISLEKVLLLNPQITNPNKIYVGQKLIVSEVKVETKSTEVQQLGNAYANGTYRGVFYDSGVQQVGVQFTLVDNIVTAASYRTLAYKDINYRSEKEDPLVLAITEQFNELIQYMVGKNINVVLEEMYTPENIVAEKMVGLDTITGASVRSAKVISAVNDGLNRGVYSKGLPSVSYENGTYRGAFSDGGYQQVGIQFTLDNNLVTAISYRTLKYNDIDYRGEKEDLKIIAINDQFNELIQYLNGKDIRTALDELYAPERIVSDKEVVTDVVTGASVRSTKVISSINDGLNRGVYAYGANTTPQLSIATKSFEDGTYRGNFIDGEAQQVGVQLTLANNIVTSISYRVLGYGGTDYIKEAEDKRVVALTTQYNELIQHLMGKDIRENLHTLYTPGAFVQDQKVELDTVTGATVRGNKVVSAIMDALNRRLYSK